MNKMTREEAIKAFKNCKFFVKSPEKSEAAQRVLFSLGFKWKSGDTTPSNQDAALLLVNDGTLYWSELGSWNKHKVPTVDVDDIINSYSSRKLRKQASKPKPKFKDGQILFSPKNNCILVYRGVNETGGILTDTYMYLDGDKMFDIGSEVTNGNGYVEEYQPANDEQKAKLSELVHDALEVMKERVQRLNTILYDE